MTHKFTITNFETALNLNSSSPDFGVDMSKRKCSEEETWQNHSLSEPKKARQNKKLITHTQKLREYLSDIRISVKIREWLIYKYRYKCELHLPESIRWKRTVEADNRMFYFLERQLEQIGDKTTNSQVRDLEEKATAIWKRTRSIPSYWAEDPRASPINFSSGLKEGWNWEDATRRGGPGLEEMVDPKDRWKENPSEEWGGNAQISTIIKHETAFLTEVDAKAIYLVSEDLMDLKHRGEPVSGYQNLI